MIMLQIITAACFIALVVIGVATEIQEYRAGQADGDGSDDA